jgi:hypothetical protein
MEEESTVQTPWATMGRPGAARFMKGPGKTGDSLKIRSKRFAKELGMKEDTDLKGMRCVMVKDGRKLKAVCKRTDKTEI